MDADGDLPDLLTRDALTGLLNRRGLEQRLDACFAPHRAMRVSLLHLEIDHLERIERAHGRREADALQSAVAATLSLSVRGGDGVARIADGAFVVACVDADPAVTGPLIERLQEAAAAARHRPADRRRLLRCTASAGLTRHCSTRERCGRFLQELDSVREAAQDSERLLRLEAARQRFAASVS